MAHRTLLALACCGGLIVTTVEAEKLAVSEAGSRMLNDVKVLASDEFEGRGVGTKGLDLAAEYISRAFEEVGLDVQSAGGDPLQEFEVTDGAVLGSPNTLQWTAPDGTLITLEHGKDVHTCSFSEAGTFSAPLVFAGYGIESDEPAYNDFEGIDIKGKAVIIMRRNPQQADPKGMFAVAGHHGAVSRHAAIRSKVSNAFRQGAAAVLFVNDPYTERSTLEQIATQLREAQEAVRAANRQIAEAGDDPQKLEEARKALAQAQERVRRTEEVAAETDADPLMEFGYGGTKSGKTVPIVHVTQEACNRVLKSALGKTIDDIEAEIDRTGRPLSAELEGWTASGQTSLQVQRVPVANVVGVLEGEGPLADETIVIGAHYDHLGMGGEGSLSPGTNEVHNGADDNASGTAGLIELARRFASRDEKPRRRLVFIAFTGEERGLLGSAHYVREPLFPLEKTVAMFNMDMIGRMEENKLTVFGTGTSTRWEDLLTRAAEGADLALIRKPEGFGPSDHSSFYAKQIPVLHLFTGTHNDYHRPTDDWEKINAEGMCRIIDFLEAIVDDTLVAPSRPDYVEIEQRATLARSGSRPYFGSIPDFGTETEGYALQGVSPGSPADKAGLMAGDVIVQFGADKIGSLDDFDLALRKFSPGEEVQVTVMRNGKSVKLTVVLAAPRS